MSQSTGEILLLSVSKKKKRLPYWNSTSIFDFDIFTDIGIWFSNRSVYQITSESDHPWKSCNVLAISKMVAVSHVEFGYMVAHPQSAIGGLCIILKFRLDRIYVIGDSAVLCLGFFTWNCLFTPTFRAFWGIFLEWRHYRSNPQKGGSTSFEPWSVKIGPTVRPGCVPEKKEEDSQKVI